MLKSVRAFTAAGAILVAAGSASGQVVQEAAVKTANNTAELAQKLSNPVADMVSVPFQFNWNGRIGPFDKGQTAYMNFQPVIPIKINQDLNVIARTVAPFSWQTSIFPHAGTQWGIGNIEQSFFVTPTNPVGGWILGAGPILYLPTATDKLLGTAQTGAGPTAIALRIDGPWTYGMLVNQVWGFMGPIPQHGYQINQIYMQPFVAYNTKSAWTFMLNSESMYNWSTQKWSMPFNFVVSKLVMIDKQPVSFGVGVRYFAASPHDGPKGFGVRALITFLLPEK